MTLTARQRTKINAALCLIYDNGHDAKAVIAHANSLTREGQDPRSAYEAALNGYLENQPALPPVIGKVLNLLDASDDRTVDQYDAALSDYATTGDQGSLTALAPMIAKDSLALAVHNGDLTQEEADSGDLSKVLGFEPGAALQEAYASADQQPQPQPSQRFGFGQQSAAPTLENASPAPDYGNGSQVSASDSPTGTVAPNSARLWAMDAAAREAVNGAGAPSL